MDLEALGNLGDFIGGIAVLLTLVYLAVQVRNNSQLVRQNSDLLRARTFRESQTAHSEATSLLANNRELADIYHRGTNDPTSLTPVERERFAWFYAMFLANFQASYYQMERGLLDPELWESEIQNLKTMLANPGGANVWAGAAPFYNKRFREYVQRLMAELIEAGLIDEDVKVDFVAEYLDRVPGYRDT